MGNYPYTYLTLFRMSLFRATQIPHSLIFCKLSAFFHQKINFCYVLKKIHKKMHLNTLFFINSFDFFESLEVVLINMIAILLSRPSLEIKFVTSNFLPMRLGLASPIQILSRD